MRWPLYLLASFLMQVVAWIITPVLPMFARQRFGAWDNAKDQRFGYRLPDWLAWFQTPDNALDGDYNWLKDHYQVSYWSMVGWLYRNSLYDFKWSVLSAPMDKDAREIHGESPMWSSHGFQRIKMGSYWQWHLVKQIGPVVINWNFGWLLNDGDQQRALFMFSPRFRLKR